MAYNQDSFSNYNNNTIVALIEEINEVLHDNLPIADASRFRGGARRMNIRTLCDYLNRHNAQQIIGVPFDDEKFGEFINNEQNRRQSILNNEQNYDQDIANRESFYDDEIDEADISYFNEQQQKIKREFEIENAIKRAHDAVSEAIMLIKDSKAPVLKKVEPKNIKNKSHLLEYYIPENEELYEFLD